MDKSVLIAIVASVIGFFAFMFSVVLFNEWYQKKRRERRERSQMSLENPVSSGTAQNRPF